MSDYALAIIDGDDRPKLAGLRPIAQVRTLIMIAPG